MTPQAHFLSVGVLALKKGGEFSKPLYEKKEGGGR